MFTKVHSVCKYIPCQYFHFLSHYHVLDIVLHINMQYPVLNPQKAGSEPLLMRKLTCFLMWSVK